MALPAGTLSAGTDDGTMQVRTYREGLAQKVGHDLIIDVGQWRATIAVGGDGAPASIGLEVDSGSFQGREGLHGVKPLTDKDQGGDRQTNEAKILRRQPITVRA